ncbi:MAG: hypothetical protein SFU98_02560 [Leptospiraceae bacterium]|nr:hypothetical protein [Leptospiraceae bacterium]
MYCEKPFTGEYFEVTNSISNIFFLISAFLLYRRFRLESENFFFKHYYSILITIIGLGSFSWHFYRIKITLALDSIPILIFVLSFLFHYTRKISTHLTKQFLFLGLFFPYVFLFFKISQISILFKAKSEGYFIAMSYLLILQIYNYYHNKWLVSNSLKIFFLFNLSIFFRELDTWICGGFYLYQTPKIFTQFYIGI